MSDEAAEVAARSSQVDLFLVKKDKINALVAALANPPVNTKEDSIKQANADIVEKVLAQFSENDIPNALNALSIESCDVLMKYLYRLMGQPRDKTVEKDNKFNYALVLKMHAQLVEKAGVGSIVRVMTDRKQV